MRTTTKIILAAALAASGLGFIQAVGASHASDAPIVAAEMERRIAAKRMARESPGSNSCGTLQR